jgi:hypothetical protein
MKRKLRDEFTTYGTILAFVSTFVGVGIFQAFGDYGWMIWTWGKAGVPSQELTSTSPGQIVGPIQQVVRKKLPTRRQNFLRNKMPETAIQAPLLDD